MATTVAQRSPFHAQSSSTTLIAGVRKTGSTWLAVWWRRKEEGPCRVCRVTIGHPAPDAALAAGDFSDAVDEELGPDQIKLLERLCDGMDGQMHSYDDVQLDLDHLGPFARKVIERCRQIPVGETMTYSELAAACGSPKAARAVGNAMANNRFPLIVPCHRVVGSGGSLGGFSAPQGIALKRYLLRREGVEI